MMKCFIFLFLESTHQIDIQINLELKVTKIIVFSDDFYKAFHF